ncbi:DUF4190 domain-containing protein [Mycolicibacterium sediminis]|uniref:Membrane protein n=1 Tax=Mycolicibacterium sediminis TaxID=1286180 RepID=A0A7I7QXY2_9MYCO|nr:DUF4190 domain-containing protein [Mycolicibacterium sediminis]BBY31239.1 membrane protein [Mycolicibacterium sediminis]
MTSGPEPRRNEFAPLDGPATPDPYAPLDYPAGPDLPPPVYDAYPPPPGYGPPPPYPMPAAGYQYGGYDPYRATKPPGTNGKAIAALVTSLGGLLFCGLPSIVGLILGIVALRETRSTGQDGFGLALAGTIVGALVAIGSFLYFVMFVGIMASGFSLV